jgi:hypothetical protein
MKDWAVAALIHSKVGAVVKQTSERIGIEDRGQLSYKEEESYRPKAEVIETGVNAYHG